MENHEVFVSKVKICSEHSSQQRSQDDEDLAAFFEVDGLMDATPFYQFGPTHKAPLETLDIDNDAFSQVSNMTPLSTADISSVVEDSTDEKDQETEACKREEFGFVADVASFAIAKMLGAMNDLADSIDPSVLEECHDGAKSMLGNKPWLIALDDFKNPSFTKVSVSMASAESKWNECQTKAIDRFDSDRKKQIYLPALKPPQRSRKKDSTTPPSTQPTSRQNQEKNLFLFEQPDGIELTLEGGIIDYGHLGIEIEVAVCKNELVFDSWGARTEIHKAPVHHCSAWADDEESPSKTKEIVVELFGYDSPKKQIFQRIRRIHRLFRVHPAKRQNFDDLKLPVKILSEPAASNETRRRCGGKTVSTVYSDESTRHTAKGGGKTVYTMHSDESTMHTTETTWRRKDACGHRNTCIS